MKKIQEKNMENGRPIMVHIKASQKDNGGAIDNMEFYTEGKYYEKLGSTYISYVESELSGLQGTTTYIKFSGEEAALIRSGAYSSKMHFKVGSETKNQYITEYGVFDMSVLTEALDINVCNDLISSVYLKYRLSINYGEAYTNEMDIRIVPR
jgi:uncharacterized beta-barrel protein YwiB (DUF1934 family)